MKIEEYIKKIAQRPKLWGMRENREKEEKIEKSKKKEKKKKN